MNEITRDQTIAAVKGIYSERLHLVNRAYTATELARDHAGYYMQLEQALECLRLAKIQIEVDLANQIKYWEEKP